MQSIFGFYRNLFADNRYWFQMAATWFGLAAVFGFVTYFINPNLMQIIAETFEERFGAHPALNFDLGLQIFKQNLIASAIALFGGVVLGLTPLLIVTVNGFLLGFITAFILFQSELASGILLLLGGILPHGVIEIPVFLIAASLGLRIGWEWLYKDKTGIRLQTLGINLKQAVMLLPGIAFALFVAALIEVFVSGKIVDNF